MTSVATVAGRPGVCCGERLARPRQVLVVAVAALVALVASGAVAVTARLWRHGDTAAPSGRAVADLADGDEVVEAVDDIGARGVTILGLSAAALAVAVCATLFGLLVVLVRTRAGLDVLDQAPARWAARHDSPFSTRALRLLTFLGSVGLALPLVVAVGAAEHRRLPDRSILWFLALVEGGQLLLVNLVKVLVARARPDVEQLAGVSSHSFPSGHTATAAATFAALALLLGRRRRLGIRQGLAAAAGGLTALVACSRVLLGVHWVTDVLAGAALGWGWAALCSIAFGGRLLRFGAPVEAGGAELADAGSKPPRERCG